jgi:hypothetical protein
MMTKMIPTLKTLSLIGLAVCISACSSGTVGKTLGLSKTSPDEFMVISRAPLTLPPDFTLRPPEQASIKNSKAREAAKHTLLKESTTPALGETSKGESVLLNKAGAAQANPNIKQLLRDENQQLTDEHEASPLAGLISDGPNLPSEPTVDVDAEEKRIEDNAKEGRAVTDGETPTNDSKKKEGLLNQWLDL